MVSRSKKSFLKRNQKTIVLVTVILGVLYFGLPYLQSGYTLTNVNYLGDSEAANGEFVEALWITGDGSYWSQAWWGYMIYIDDVPAFISPSVFENNPDITTVISYNFQINDHVAGDIIEVKLEMLEDPSGEITASHTATITVLESETPPETTTTETSTTSTGTGGVIDGMDDMKIIYVMAMAGGIIFVMAIVAVFMRR